MRAIVGNAYAKINLLLNIVGKRPDGYHELDGVMAPISLYDTIRVEKSGRLSVVCGRCGLPEESNSAYKMAQIFFRETGIPGGAEIFIRKRIPKEAGLGGGSSDAAFVLRALNTLYDAGLTPAGMNRIAASLGADIPFFLQEGAKRARGIGELLDPVPWNLETAILIVKPSGGVNTALAYKAFHGTAPEPAGVEACIRALKENDVGLFSKNAKNMLQEASSALLPDIGNALAALHENGAAFALMTGSGSAVYGLFKNMEMAEKAAAKIAGKGFEFVLPVSYTEKTVESLLEIY
jgi:4-diphosphocytidyl-2-C-methyl-D-erythritol kinase